MPIDFSIDETSFDLIDFSSMQKEFNDLEIYAFDNRCPHRGGSIGNGTMKNGIISCPWHKWKFDSKTGKAIENEIHCLKVYPLEKRNDGVYIKLK